MATLPGINIPITVEDQRFTQSLARVSQGVTQLGQTATRTGGLFQSGFGNKIQQTSFQLADFAVQLQSGQGFMRAFVQQGSQVAASFGPIGAAAGAAIAVIGGLAGALFSSREASAAAADATRALSEELVRENDTVESLSERLGGLTSVHRDLAELQLAKQVRDETAALEAQQAAAEDLVASVGALQAGFAARIEGFGLQFIPIESMTEGQKLLEETLDTVRETGVVTHELARQFDALATASGDPALRKVADEALGVALAAEQAQQKLDAAEGAMGRLGDTARRGSEDLKKAALAMADVEFEASGLAVAEAKKEVEARSKAIDETARLRKAAAADAAREAKQAAETEAREALAPWVKNQRSLLEISEDFTKRAASQKFKAAEDAARDQERLQEKASAEQIRQAERHADLMLEPVRASAVEFGEETADLLEEVLKCR